MKKYTEPAMRITEFADENVITVSGGSVEGGSNAIDAKNEIGTANVETTSYKSLFVY
ncbi:MAG: hypothetical protein ACI38A_00010 [Candidatus Ornithomonoglobus sp.]